MAYCASIRRIRRLSTAASAAVKSTETEASSITISKAKSKLRNEYDPDKALEIYSSVFKNYASPVSSRYAQDLTVRRLAKSHRLEDVESFIESHKNDPKITQEPYLSSLIRSYGQVGMFDHAMRTYDQMDELGTPRSVISFNALLSACNQSKLFEKVPELFEEIPSKYGISPDKISHGILVKSYCEAGSLDKAMNTLREMEEKGVEITSVTFTTLLDALYKKGNSEEAEKLWDTMVKKDCEIDVAAHNVRIMYEQDGDPEKVKAMIEEMSNSGLKPNAISYNYLMTSYCKSGMIDEAQKVYDGLQEKRCKPNAATFRTLIFYLCKNERYEKGYVVFKESVKMHRIPDFYTMKDLVTGLVKIKQMKAAKGLIRTIKKQFPPNLLKAWARVEKDLGLTSVEDSSS